MLDQSLRHWLDNNANELDLSNRYAETLLPRLADAGLFRIGVPNAFGGSDGTVTDAVYALSEVAGHSMTAAFVYWGQRAFIEFLLHTPNIGLRDRLLPGLLSGELAGASGLSNAMKFLSGVEALQITASDAGNSSRSLNGQLHWVTNLRPGNFVVAAAVHDNRSNTPFIAVLSSADVGLTRSDDLSLMALQGSYTAAIQLQDVAVSEQEILHPQASPFLAQCRPAFLGLQCGMSLGITARALHQTENQLGSRHILHDDWQTLTKVHAEHRSRLLQGLSNGDFQREPTALFRLRIEMIDTANHAMQLELLASGGKAYLTESGSHFARRWREVAFLPIVTPSITQLRFQLARENA